MKSKANIVKFMLLIGWFAGVLLRFMFFGDYWFFGFIITYPMDAILFAVGLGLVAVSTINIYKKRSRVLHGFIALWVVLIVFLGWGTDRGRYMGRCFRLWRYEAEHERYVEKLLSGDQVDLFTYDCRVDEGPPMRIAFSWGGLLGTWYGIVYDPTGEVMNANKEGAAALELFGDFLTSSQHLWDDWYFCWFT